MQMPNLLLLLLRHVYVSQVGSRAVVLLSAGFMIVFGVFTKFGALFVTIPDPVIAGTFFILFGETAVTMPAIKCSAFHDIGCNRREGVVVFLNSIKLA